MLRQNSGYYDGWYTVPAGHVEEGELPMEAMIREAKEEIGINLAHEDLHAVHAMYRTAHDATGDRVDYFFEATTWSGEPTNAEPHKCVELRWCSVSALPEKMMHHVKDALMDIQHGVNYSEIGKDKIIRL